MSSSGLFKVAGQTYEYLNEMEKAYPYFVKAEPEKVKTKEEAVAPSKDKIKKDKSSESSKSNKNKEKVPKVKQETRKQALARKRQEAREAHLKKVQEERSAKDSPKEVAIAETRARIQSGIYKEYHAKKIAYLSNIPNTCLTDFEKLDFVEHVRIEKDGAIAVCEGWCCLRCNTVYLPLDKKADIDVFLSKKQPNVTKRTAGIVIQYVPASISNGEVNFTTPDATLYVCKGMTSCKRNSHKVESATGLLLNRSGAIIKININYCPECRRCFISYDEYQNYKKIYGGLLGNIKITNGSYIPFEADLAQESILSICGYSVNQTENLSPAIRQGILQYLIDSKVSNKPEIIDYLNFFIKRNGKKANMEEAVRRWNEDLKWVREYQINRQRKFEISNIQKKK